MKTMRILGAVAFLAAAAAAAWAGGACCGGGWGCKNKSAEAQEATQCRSYGNECPASKHALGEQVAKNCSKI